jgi:hypothetical protein
MTKTKKRKRENPQLHISGSNLISDAELAASAFDWDPTTSVALWQAVLDDDITGLYYFCKANSIVPETLQIGEKHIWELAFQYGSWLTCMWILCRVCMRFPLEEKIKLSLIIAEMDEDALKKFVKIWFDQCPAAFNTMIFFSPARVDKWQRVMSGARKAVEK